MARTEVTGSQIRDKSVSLTDDVTGVLPVANGGIGSSSLASNNVLLGNGTGGVQGVAPGASGNVLTSNGTTWVSSAAASGGGVSRSVQTVSGNTTLAAAANTDYIYYAVDYGNGTTLTLPSAANNSNIYYIFTRSSSSFSLTIARSGSDTIEGNTSITVNNNTVTKLMSNGSNRWKNLSPGVLQ